MSLLRRIEPYPNLCSFCKYKRTNVFTKLNCHVFEHFGKEIPIEIHLSKFDHRYPHPEDGGIQFEPATEEQMLINLNRRNLTPLQIEADFEQVIARLEATYENGEVPTNDGHLPSIWFMHDD